MEPPSGFEHGTPGFHIIVKRMRPGLTTVFNSSFDGRFIKIKYNLKRKTSQYKSRLFGLISSFLINRQLRIVLDGKSSQ